MSLKLTMLRVACFRRVRARGTTEATDTVRPSMGAITPRTLPELAKILRDPMCRLRCPFGVDFDKQSAGASRLDGLHRVPFWWALMELHRDGYVYGIFDGGGDGDGLTWLLISIRTAWPFAVRMEFKCFVASSSFVCSFICSRTDDAEMKHSDSIRMLKQR